MRSHGSGSPWFLLVVTAVLVEYAYTAENCPELPVFSPRLLVVKFGDPAFATCSIICNGTCENELHLEEPFSSSVKEENQIIWQPSSVTDWNVRPLCAIMDSECMKTLPVTVYQPPHTVSLSFGEASGPQVEGSVYSLQCEVWAVAPAQNMAVTFYKGHEELDVQRSRTSQKTPVNESFSLMYNMSREDHGAHFWCEVKLELGPEGPQPPPVVTSQNVTVNVHYAPYTDASAEPQLLTVLQGDSAKLDCSSEGNPSPHYSWSIPSDSNTLFSESVFTIHSASAQHEGLYSCNASNSVGSVKRSFTLKVHVNYVTTIVIAVVAALLLIGVVASVFYLRFYRPHHSGTYNPIRRFLSNQHPAAPLP